MNRLHRVLIRVERVNETHMAVVIPSWRPDEYVKLPKTLLPEGMSVADGDYLLAEVYLDAKEVEDLNIQQVSENLGPVTDETLA